MSWTIAEIAVIFWTKRLECIEIECTTKNLEVKNFNFSKRLNFSEKTSYNTIFFFNSKKEPAGNESLAQVFSCEFCETAKNTLS